MQMKENKEMNYIYKCNEMKYIYEWNIFTFTSRVTVLIKRNEEIGERATKTTNH